MFFMLSHKIYSLPRLFHVALHSNWRKLAKYYVNCQEEACREEQETSSFTDAKHGNIVQKKGRAVNKGSKRDASSKVSQTYSRRASRIKVKLKGKILDRTQDQADATERKIGFEVPSDTVKLYEIDPEALRRIYFRGTLSVSVLFSVI